MAGGAEAGFTGSMFPRRMFTQTTCLDLSPISALLWKAAAAFAETQLDGDPFDDDAIEPKNLGPLLEQVCEHPSPGRTARLPERILHAIAVTSLIDITWRIFGCHFQICSTQSEARRMVMDVCC